MTIVLVFLPLALVLVGLQATVIGHFHLFGGHADIVLVGVALLTTVAGRRSGLLLAGVAAPLYDMLAGLPVGVTVLPLLAVALLTAGGERTLFGARLGWPVFLTFGATLVAGGITLLELSLLGWPIAWGDTLLRVTLPGALLNAGLMLVLFLPAEWLREHRPVVVAP
jgi:cell shape-determining protein MreD